MMSPGGGRPPYYPKPAKVPQQPQWGHGVYSRSSSVSSYYPTSATEDDEDTVGEADDVWTPPDLPMLQHDDGDKTPIRTQDDAYTMQDLILAAGRVEKTAAQTTRRASSTADQRATGAIHCHGFNKQLRVEAAKAAAESVDVEAVESWNLSSTSAASATQWVFFGFLHSGKVISRH